MAVSAVGNQSDPNVQADYQSRVDSSSRHHERTRRSERESDQNSGNNYESRFRRSNESENQSGASEAGTYQISQFQVFSASATVLLAQNGSATQATATQSPATSATQAATNPATTAPTTTTPTAPSSAAPSQSGVSQPLPPVTTAASQTANPVSTGAVTQPPTDNSSASASGPLQALNNVLQTLGLSQQDIQAFDQVASIIQSFSPAAFTDLVNAFQTLAQEISQTSQNAPAASSNTSPSNSQSIASSTGAAVPASTAAPASTTSATTSSATTPATTSTPSATSAPANTSANTPASGIQVEELSIRFSALEIQATTGNPSASNSGSTANSGSSSGGSTGGTFDLTAFQLNVSEVNVTLPDGSPLAPPVQPPPITAQSAVTGATPAGQASSNVSPAAA